MPINRSSKYYFTGFLLVWIISVIIWFPLEKGTGLYFAKSLRTDLHSELMLIITRLSEEWIYLFLIVGLLWKNVKHAIMVACGGLASLALSAILKWYFELPRPKVWLSVRYKLEEFEGIAGHYIHDGFNSFPSGHTTSAFILAGLCAYFFPKLKWIFLFLAMAVGWSRVYLVQHFFEDILFGSILGSFVSLIIIILLGTRWPQLEKGAHLLKKKNQEIA